VEVAAVIEDRRIEILKAELAAARGQLAELQHKVGQQDIFLAEPVIRGLRLTLEAAAAGNRQARAVTDPLIRVLRLALSGIVVPSPSERGN
jgi:hypothetical protein